MNYQSNKAAISATKLPALIHKANVCPPTHVYVPETFDPKESLPVYLQSRADCARYFLHRIIWGKVQRRMTREQYVPIKFAYLRAVIPDRVIRPLKQALLDAEVIECDGYYTEGFKAFGYRLGPLHRDARIVRVPLSDETTANRLRANRQAEYKKVRLDVHRYLRSHYYRLEINLPLALRLLKGHPEFELVKLPAEQIAGKDYHFKACRYGRIHTDLTRCPRQIRPALTIEGQSLVEIDIANSQPLFLALLLINFRKHGNKTFACLTFPEQIANPYAKIDEIIQNTVHPCTYQEEESSTPSPSGSITNRKQCDQIVEVASPQALASGDYMSGWEAAYGCLLKSDERTFIGLCESGELYESFMDRLEIYHRGTLKDRFFLYLFGRNHLQSPLKADFSEIFPNVAKVVQLHKRKDHAFLPRLMQNIEATFIINTVCRRLMRESPEVPIITIHDCLLTTPPHADTIHRVMREGFHRLGLNPTFHVKRHGDTPGDGSVIAPNAPESIRVYSDGPEVV